MAAGEDEPEAVVGLARRLGQGGEQLQLLPVSRLPADPVEALAPRRRQQPGAGAIGDSLPRPVLQGLDQRLRDELLGQVEVAEVADQARREPARLLSEDTLQQGVRPLPGVSAR